MDIEQLKAFERIVRGGPLNAVLAEFVGVLREEAREICVTGYLLGLPVKHRYLAFSLQTWVNRLALKG